MFAFTQPARSGKGPRVQSLSHLAIRLGCGAFLAASLACGKDSTGPEPEAIEGRYALETVDGRSLPVVILEDETETIQLIAGAVTLSAPRAFTMELTLKETTAEGVSTGTSQVSGTWTRSGETVRLTVDGEVVTATVSGGTLRLTDGADDLGMGEWVFRK
jgi:hypothetical protein